MCPPAGVCCCLAHLAGWYSLKTAREFPVQNPFRWHYLLSHVTKNTKRCTLARRKLLLHKRAAVDRGFPTADQLTCPSSCLHTGSHSTVPHHKTHLSMLGVAVWGDGVLHNAAQAPFMSQNVIFGLLLWLANYLQPLLVYWCSENCLDLFQTSNFTAWPDSILEEGSPQIHLALYEDIFTC